MRIVGSGQYRAEHEHDLLIAQDLLGAAAEARARADHRLLLAEAFFRGRVLEVARKDPDAMVAAGQLMESLTHDAHAALLEQERWELAVKAGPIPRHRIWTSTVAPRTKKFR
jgi:hypothetical protein